MKIEKIIDTHYKVPRNISIQILEQAMSNITDIDEELRGGIASALPPEKTVLNYGNRSYRIIYYINVVCGVKTPTVLRIDLPNYDNGKAKLLIPYQFTGLVTAPADGPKPDYLRLFFKRIFESFYNFVKLLISLPAMTWFAFVKFVLSDGSPGNVTRGWISRDNLEKRKDDIHIEDNPLIPSDILPLRGVTNGHLSVAQTGLGLYTSMLSSAYLTQLIDNNYKDVGERINNLSTSAGWYVQPDTTALCVQWLSNNYNYVDGECFGSFLYLEEI